MCPPPKWRYVWPLKYGYVGGGVSSECVLWNRGGCVLWNRWYVCIHLMRPLPLGAQVHVCPCCNRPFSTKLCNNDVLVGKRAR